MPETMYLVPNDSLVPVAEPVEAAKVAAPAATKSKPAIQEIPALPKVEKPTPPPAAPADAGKYLMIGENMKGVVVLVTLPDAAFRNLPQLPLLQKMLAAIGFKPEDVAYVNNVSGETAVFEDLLQLLPVKYIISFASRLDTNQPHEKFTLYNPVKVADVPVVFSQSLEVLERDIVHKKKLWAVFQQVFL